MQPNKKETRGSATHRKKVKTPLVVKVGDTELHIPGQWKTAIKTAKALAGELSEKNVGKPVHVFEQLNPEPIWTARLTYSWDDPVWQAIPTHEDCEELFQGLIRQLFVDAGVIKVEWGRKWNHKSDDAHKRTKKALAYIQTKDFEDVCLLAGLNHSWLRGAI
jgi:hypothetical protein